ncbi:DUF3592 domain-containing protein [Amycolatopsis sp. NPDC004368]
MKHETTEADTAACDSAVRQRVRWTAVVAVVFLVLLGVSAFGAKRIFTAYNGLQVNGAPATGKVTEVSHSRRGVSTFEVAYSANGTREESSFSIDGDNAYSVGQTVTVRYDPADPAHAEVDGQVAPFSREGLIALAVLVSLVVCVWSALVSLAWARRRRGEGWQWVETTDPARGGNPALSFLCTGSGIKAKRTRHLRAGRFALRPGPPVAGWLSGDGKVVTLVVPPAKDGGRPSLYRLRDAEKP